MKEPLTRILMAAFLLIPAKGLAEEIKKPKFTKEKLLAIVRDAEIRYSIPSDLLHSIIIIESDYRVDAINRSERKGVVTISYGLGQIIMWAAEAHCNNLKSIYNPLQNVDCAARIVKYKLDRYFGNVDKAIAAYNSGTICECNGKKYVMILNRKTVTCGDSRKCNKKGEFANQEYVDLVNKVYKKTMGYKKRKEEKEKARKLVIYSNGTTA